MEKKSLNLIRIVLPLIAIIVMFVMRESIGIPLIVAVFGLVLDFNLFLAVKNYIDNLKNYKKEKDELVADLIRLVSFYWIASFITVEFSFLLVLAMLIAIGILLYLILQLLTGYKSEESISFSKVIYTALAMIGINLVLYMLVLPEFFKRLIN